MGYQSIWLKMGLGSTLWAWFFALNDWKTASTSFFCLASVCAIFRIIEIFQTEPSDGTMHDPTCEQFKSFGEGTYEE